VARDSSRLLLLGIRHHGPGSARGVLAALDAADPAIVLIEGPPDANEIIPFAASAAMVPPVAILVHSQDDPANASFYPFAVFSPEWQAMRWALSKGRSVRFIDLPSANRLAERARTVAETAERAAKTAAEGNEPQTAEPAAETAATDPDQTTDDPGDGPAADAALGEIRRDPLAYLAEIAGYEDSEAWWNALIEQGAHGPDIFTSIESAIAALRGEIDELPHWSPAEVLIEKQREAHMRLAIAGALPETDDTIAVVCGAWHVPTLRQTVSARDDRALLKGLPKIKVTATWVPWTETRLAAASGYGAGVASPGWYAHLWEELHHATAAEAAAQPLAPHAFTSRWQTRVAALLRKNGRPASTASVIEAARLAISLAALRDLALPGLDEMREASLATLCEGEIAPFKLIEQQLVIGRRVGEIDEAVPQMPLAADLARWQKKLKLKPEALDSDISLDLRSEAGLAKSLLLHRLALINVPWGKMQGMGSSRGTFRENWRLRWEPEFSVRLAEALVHGTTVEQAAGNAAVAAARDAKSLDAVSKIVRGCLHAGLEQAANETIAILQREAASSSDIGALAGAIPPLGNVLRYGTARQMPTEALRRLVSTLAEVVCAGLVYACRSLEAEPAREMRERVAALDTAIALIDDAGLTEGWRRALGQVAVDSNAHPLLVGLAVRARYDQNVIDAGATARHLSLALSPSTPPLDAGDWLDGFIGSSGQILLYDNALRTIVDGWLVALGEEEFTNLLPMLRRAFSSLDRSERRRLLDEIGKLRAVAPVVSGTAESAGVMPASLDGQGAAPGFAAALPLLLTILGASPKRSGETTP
jgi:hypothetical protein